MSVRLAALLVAASLVAGNAESQNRASPSIATGRPDARDGILMRVDARFGYLITGGERFGDRPIVQVDAGAQFGPARVGGPPAIALTVGAAVGAGEFLGGSTITLRVLGGVELPFAFISPLFGDVPVELVPVLQGGYQTVFQEDERSGLTLRGALGLRFLPRNRTFFFTFEPVSIVLLAAADTPSGDRDSRTAVELGVVKVGWRF